MFIDLSLPLSFPDDDAPETNARERAIQKLGHRGTHLDRILGTRVPLEYVRSRALAFDISAFSQERPVLRADIDLESVRAGDFVIFHTGAIDRHGYGTRPYLDEFIEFSWDLLDSLIARKIRYIGLDARGVRRGAEHAEADGRCEKGGVYVVENMNNVAGLPFGRPFTAYALCFDLGGSGIPCRVVAEVEKK